MVEAPAEGVLAGSPSPDRGAITLAAAKVRSTLHLLKGSQRQPTIRPRMPFPRTCPVSRMRIRTAQHGSGPADSRFSGRVPRRQRERAPGSPVRAGVGLRRVSATSRRRCASGRRRLHWRANERASCATAALALDDLRASEVAGGECPHRLGERASRDWRSGRRARRAASIMAGPAAVPCGGRGRVRGRRRSGARRSRA